jgi:hypothetical protein
MAATRKRASSNRRSSGKPAARRRALTRARPRQGRRRGARPGLGSWFLGWLPRPLVLNQRQRDILGLALVACGIFMGFVLY